MPIDFKPSGGGKIDFQPIDFQPIEQDEWASANAGDGIRFNDQPKDEGLVDKFLRLEKRYREKKKSQLTTGGIAKMVLDAPVDPFGAVGRAYSEARQLVPDEVAAPFESLSPLGIATNMLPVGGTASIVKGYVGVPQGYGQRVLNRVAPGSEAAAISNKFSSDMNNWYRDQGFTESAYGEGMGASLAGARIPQGGGVLARGAAGGLMGLARPVSGDGWEAPTPDEVNRDSAISGGVGVVAGAGLPYASEKIGQGARAVSPYVKNMRDFLQRKLAGLGGEKPFEAFVGDLGAMQKRSNTVGGAMYDEVNKGVLGDEVTNPQQLLAEAKSIIKTLNEKPVEDPALIGRLQGIVEKLSPGKAKATGILDASGAPIMGAPAPPEATPNIRNMNELTRNLGNAIQEARNTAGQTKQITRTSEEKGILDRIRELAEAAIGDKSKEAAGKLRAADQFWAKGSPATPAPATYVDKTQLGPTVSKLRSSPNQDTVFDNLTKSKSEQFAKKLRSAISPKGEEAVGTRILERAEEARTAAAPGEGPGAWLKTVWDSGKDDLTPMGKQVFSGADADAIRGAAKIAKFANSVGDYTQIPHVLPLKRLTAPAIERLINNKATRGILEGLSKLPENSPEFARSVAALTAAMENE